MSFRTMLLALVVAAGTSTTTYAERNEPGRAPADESCFHAETAQDGTIRATMTIAGGELCQVRIMRPWLDVAVPQNPNRGRLLVMPIGFVYQADPKADGTDSFTITGMMATHPGVNALAPFTLTVTVAIGPSSDPGKPETAPRASAPQTTAKPSSIALTD